MTQEQTDTKGERRARSNTRAVRRLVRTLHDGKGVAPITLLQSRRVKISQEGPIIAMDYYFMKCTQSTHPQRASRTIQSSHKHEHEMRACGSRA